MNGRERVWNWLKRKGPARRVDIAAALKLPNNTVGTLLFRMMQDGYIGRELGFRRVAKWYAIGDAPPECLLGTHPNTLRNLNHSRDVALERLRKAWIAKGLDPSRLGRPPDKVTDGCLLSQCWNNNSCKRAA